MAKLTTDRQAAILNFIVVFTKESGYPPTVREIGNGLQIKNPNGVQGHLVALEKKGLIKRNPRLSRAIQII